MIQRQTSSLILLFERFNVNTTCIIFIRGLASLQDDTSPQKANSMKKSNTTHKGTRFYRLDVDPWSQTEVPMVSFF